MAEFVITKDSRGRNRKWTVAPSSMPVADKLIAYSDDGPNGCRLWKRAITPLGYSVIKHGDRVVRAHRLSYETFVGPIPDGLQIDHLCRNRACINPAHLEPVTQRENILRGESTSAQCARKTHCQNGHLFAGDNLYVSRAGRRSCRICLRAKDARRRPRKRAAK